MQTMLCVKLDWFNLMPGFWTKDTLKPDLLSQEATGAGGL